MGYELWFNRDGSTTGWSQADEIWFNIDGTTSGWKQADEGWVNIDGTTTGWKQFFSAVQPTLLTATQKVGSDGSDCSDGKCVRCVEWTYENAADLQHHIRVLYSAGGSSYYEAIDDQALARRCATQDTACGDAGCTSLAGSKGCYCHTCGNDGTTYQYKVRLELDGTDTLAGTNCELTTGTTTNCGGAS